MPDNQHPSYNAVTGAKRNLLRKIPQMRQVFILFLLLLVLCVGDTPALGCPNCKDGLADNQARGYFLSILFMMSMPFLMIGAFSTYMYVEIRRARAASGHPLAATGRQKHPSSDLRLALERTGAAQRR